MKTQAWTIKQLDEAMRADLLACQSEFERINVKAICGAEIRRMADEWSKSRKLTPCELAIAESHGYATGWRTCCGARNQLPGQRCAICGNYTHNLG